MPISIFLYFTLITLVDNDFVKCTILDDPYIYFYADFENELKFILRTPIFVIDMPFLKHVANNSSLYKSFFLN